MGTIYMVTGNNLFGQWLRDAPIFKKFEVVSKNPTQAIKFEDSPTPDLKLKHMSWSYNIFQCENKLYVSGAWDNDENVVKKLEIFCNDELNASDLLVTSNDDFLYIADAKRLKLWIMEFDEISTFRTMDLDLRSYERGDENNDLQIVKMIASNKMVLFLTNEGYVFTDIPPSQMCTGHCLGKICDIACGSEHYMLLTEVGLVYTWGSGKRFQLGHGNLHDLDIPTEVEGLCGIIVIKIAAGSFHCLTLSKYGDAYAWGWNENGQLGIFDSLEQQPTILRPVEYSIPNLITIYNEEGEYAYEDIVDIACGSKHSALKLEDNTVWTCGFNKYGQLGLSMDLFPCSKYYRKTYECPIDFQLMCGTWTTAIEIENQ